MGRFDFRRTTSCKGKITNTASRQVEAWEMLLSRREGRRQRQEGGSEGGTRMCLAKGKSDGLNPAQA